LLFFYQNRLYLYSCTKTNAIKIALPALPAGLIFIKMIL
jgi:hypothetical protein